MAERGGHDRTSSLTFAFFDFSFSVELYAFKKSTMQTVMLTHRLDLKLVGVLGGRNAD